jgi:hypothetical protein
VATARAFAIQERSKVRFPHLQKALTADEKFIREFYGKDASDSLFF